MTYLETRDHQETRFPPTTAAQLAAWRKARGNKVLERQGGYWVETAKGFYQSIHWLARMPIDLVGRPSPFCWGYRATLDEQSAIHSNATMPVHLLSRVSDYDMGSLTSRQRNKLRNSLKQVEIVELTGPELLFEQGHPVFSSAVQRTGYGLLVSLPCYRENVRNFYQYNYGIVIAGLIKGRLAGYITAYSVDSTAYIEDVYIRTEDLNTNISLGLFYAISQACRRSEQITELVHGLHTPENASLCRHKEGLGFEVVHIPSRVWFFPKTGNLVRKVKPNTYYRLTGRYQVNEEDNYNKARHCQSLRGQNHEIRSNN